jgi:hypothetical protein
VPAAVRSNAPEAINPLTIRGSSSREKRRQRSRSSVKREGPRDLDRRLLKAFSVTGFSLVALDEVILHHLQIDPPLTTNPEGRQLPQAHAAIDRRLRDPKVRGQLFQRDHFGVGNSSVRGNLVIGSVRWLAPPSVAGGCGVTRVAVTWSSFQLLCATDTAFEQESRPPNSSDLSELTIISP